MALSLAFVLALSLLALPLAFFRFAPLLFCGLQGVPRVLRRVPTTIGIPAIRPLLLASPEQRRVWSSWPSFLPRRVVAWVLLTQLTVASFTPIFVPIERRMGSSVSRVG